MSCGEGSKEAGISMDLSKDPTRVSTRMEKRLQCMICSAGIKNLEKRFSKEIPLVTAWGKLLEYLGMTLNYCVKGKVKMSMMIMLKNLRRSTK